MVESPSLTDFLSRVDVAGVLDRTRRLSETEAGQCFRHYEAAARFTGELLREAGLENVELIPEAADGETVHLDRRMPLAWDVHCATLTVREPRGLFHDPVVASYERHPFHAVKGSVGTPPGGVLARLIPEDRLLAGQDAAGAMVILEPDTRPRGAMLTALLDLGALGFVTDAVSARATSPDALPWVNGCTEGANWHAQAGDRPFIGFAVTPRTGDTLRAAARRGPVVVHVESDARRYAGRFHHVTGVIPGDDPRELWLTAHLYEPFPDDNAVGVTGSIEAARLIRSLLAGRRPRFTLRLLFTLEMYGVAAYAARRGVPLGDRVLGALNFDSALGHSRCGTLHLAAAPFFGDYVLEAAVDESRALGRPERIAVQEAGWYADDQFVNDPAVGVPMAWLIDRYTLHHTTAQTMEIIHPDGLALHVALYTAALWRLLTLDAAAAAARLEAGVHCAARHIRQEGEAIRQRLNGPDLAERARARAMAATWMGWRVERERERLADLRRFVEGVDVAAACGGLAAEAERALAVPTCPAADAAAAGAGEPAAETRAAGITAARRVPWPIYEEAVRPPEQRTALPDRVIYGPFAAVLARMDGRRNLRELMDYAAWRRGRPIDAAAAKACLRGIEHLGEHGDLEVRYTGAVTRADIAAALRRAGVTPGAVALVHSSLSAFGHIEGGAPEVVDAFLDVLGPDGTLLVPTFTNAAFYCDGEWIARIRFRPFDVASPHLWTGRIPAALLKRGSAGGVRRSAHPTHSAAGCGPLAAACLDGHRETDAPTGPTSPFARLLDFDGMMIWFGAALGSTTFFHFLEDAAGLPFLKPALVRVRRPDGRVDTVVVPRWMPGHRDYYSRSADKGRFYSRLLRLGLEIRRVPLGEGEIRMIRARQMYDLGMRALAEDPTLPLCERPDCLFCARWRTELSGRIPAPHAAATTG